MRTWAYIDGFNLYYAIRNVGYKWIDVKELTKAVMPPSTNVEKLKYYTAHVSGVSDPDQPRRQQIYLNALGTIPEIEIFFGQFLAKSIWRPLLNLPIGDRPLHYGSANSTIPPGNHFVNPDPTILDNTRESLQVGKYGKGNRILRNPAVDAIKAMVHAMEEKGSDVNLASHLINDGWANRYEAAIVISNDTDLVEPIRIVVQELKKPVTILSPSKLRGDKYEAASRLLSVASHVRYIRKSHLNSSLFPDTISGTTITKPTGW